MYYQGTAPQQIFRGQQDEDTIPLSGGGGSVSNGYVPTAQQGQPSRPSGAISAPNSVLQNITNFSGSQQTLGGNANREAGLQNYDAMSNKYGGIMGGQWTPFGLRGEGEGGLGRRDFNYFVNPSNQTLQGGNTYDIYQNQLRQRSNYRNAYTGDIVDYGAGSMQGLPNNPLTDYFNQNLYGQNGGQPKMNFSGSSSSDIANRVRNNQANAMTLLPPNQMNQQFGQGVDAAMQAYINQLKGLGSSPLDVNAVDFDQERLKRQLVMGAMPSYSPPKGLNNQPNYLNSTSPEYQSWLRYVQSLGYLPSDVTNPNQIQTANVSGLRR